MNPIKRKATNGSKITLRKFILTTKAEGMIIFYKRCKCQGAKATLENLTEFVCCFL